MCDLGVIRKWRPSEQVNLHTFWEKFDKRDSCGRWWWIKQNDLIVINWRKHSRSCLFRFFSVTAYLQRKGFFFLQVKKAYSTECLIPCLRERTNKPSCVLRTISKLGCVRVISLLLSYSFENKIHDLTSTHNLLAMRRMSYLLMLSHYDGRSKGTEDEK